MKTGFTCNECKRFNEYPKTEQIYHSFTPSEGHILKKYSNQIISVKTRDCRIGKMNTLSS